MKARTPNRYRKTGLAVVGTVGAMLTVWSVYAAAPVKITPEVASVADLTAEAHTMLTSVEQMLASAESYNERHDQLKQQAVQIAIFAQALTEHEGESPLKKSAPSLRNAGLALARAKSYEEAGPVLPRLKEAMEGKISGTPAADAEWGTLARAATLMHTMKERSEAIRKGLRRPKDPDLESRNATAIALMILAVHGDTQAVKNAADKPVWQEMCLEVHGQMSLTAAAIKTRNSSAADHFRLGMEACDKCHQKFKP